MTLLAFLESVAAAPWPYEKVRPPRVLSKSNLTTRHAAVPCRGSATPELVCVHSTRVAGFMRAGGKNTRGNECALANRET